MAQSRQERCERSGVCAHRRRASVVRQHHGAPPSKSKRSDLNRQEMGRLLYVALTRAQHTLVLAFDNELFAKTSGEIHSHSQSKWLKADKNDVNAAAFARIGVEPASCANTTEHHRARASVPI